MTVMSFILEELPDRCSSELVKRNSKLWIDALKNPQAGKDHCQAFVKPMSEQMVAHLKDAIDPYHWPEFIQSNAEFTNNTVTYKRHLIVKHQRTLQRPAASLHT
ncbi:hypothetical protein DFH29DRAFT_632165 [Suillus ampliporus]|nr:hypothetical protein DFH29DRAFT_632165 [Suillus ampliporus]